MLPNYITFDKPITQQFDLYCNGYEDITTYKQVLLKIDLDKEEIIENRFLSENVYFYKKLSDNRDLFVKKILIEDENKIIFNNSETNITIEIPYIFDLKDFSYKNDVLVILANQILFLGYEQEEIKKIAYILFFFYPYASNFEKIIVRKTTNEDKYRDNLFSLKSCYVLLSHYNTEQYIFRIFDNSGKMLNIKNISLKTDEENIRDFRLSKIYEKDDCDELIMCTAYESKCICKIVKYENSDLILGNDLVIFSNFEKDSEEWLNKVFIFPYEENGMNKLLFLFFNYLHWELIIY